MRMRISAFGAWSAALFTSRVEVAKAVGKGFPGQDMFALVDGDNFYVSCERIFNPALQGRAVVVLSNNDGCVIARSAEAKVLGIPMGAPEYKYRNLFRHYEVAKFSANFTLYGDISQRMMNVLAGLAPALEVYSIDEAFLQLGEESPKAGVDFARKAVWTLGRWLGLPVSVGVGPTKTLAKVAVGIAKKNNTPVVLGERDAVRRALQKLSVREVWGIGSRVARKLEKDGIHSALDYASVSRDWLSRHFSVAQLRVHQELQGVSCLPLAVARTRKSVCCTRTFADAGKLRDWQPLSEAAAVFCARCAEKLRRSKMLASVLQVFVEEAEHARDPAGKTRTCVLRLPVPSDDILVLTQVARQALRRIHHQGRPCNRVGVIMAGLIPRSQTPGEMFSVSGGRSRARLMEVFDSINSIWGRGTIKSAAQGFGVRAWGMRQAHLSPNYTTRWEHLLEVRG